MNLLFALSCLLLQPNPHYTVTNLEEPFTQSVHVVHDTTLYSIHLRRRLTLDVVLPPQYEASTHAFPVLFLNDGQDLERLRMTNVLDSAYNTKAVVPFILVAIHCGERIQEYGVAQQADYKQRGAKAGSYSQFVVEELIPFIEKKYRVTAQRVMAGFSLGGLSAFDLAWNHPTVFQKAGVFSGSFWWRQKAYEANYHDDQDRIAHNMVRNAAPRSPMPNAQFWFQTGTEDEKDDRNQNGIIDSIEDTLDLMAELERKGYRWGKELRYVEVAGGHHDQATWSAVMPEFLAWAFSPPKN